MGQRHMSVPIKIGRGAFPRWCEKALPSRWNPGGLVDSDRQACSRGEDERAWFSTHVSGFSSGRTWKSTRPRRHRRTDEMILDLCRDAKPVILDVGISDGVTSLELIEKLDGRFTSYFATDRHLRVHYQRRGSRIYFYDADGTCNILSTRRFVVYLDPGAASAFRGIVRRLLAGAPTLTREEAKLVWLIQPELRKAAGEDKRIILREHDVFGLWTGPLVDIVKVANLLNLDYFPEQRIRVALTHLKEALRLGGRLFITDNRENDDEHVSVFVKEEDRFVLDGDIAGGAEISTIVQAVGRGNV